MSKDNTTEERDIAKEIETLRNTLLRDIEKIHKGTYEKVKEIMNRQNNENIDEVKNDVNVLKS